MARISAVITLIALAWKILLFTHLSYDVDASAPSTYATQAPGTHSIHGDLASPLLAHEEED